MANDNEETTDLIIPEAFGGVTERPKSLDRNDLTGTENITAEDVRLPRLAIAQGLSPQMMPDDGSYIKGLELFSMFNDLTGDKYGNGPLTFVPIRREVHRIEFLPREEGGGVVDLDVPANDKRMRWSVVDGKRIPPAATEFVEFIVLLLIPGKAPEPIVLSIKTTNKYNRRAADQLTTFIKLRQAAIYAGLYTVASKSEKSDQGTFGVYIAKNAGFIPKDTAAGAALFKYAEQFAKSLEGKNVVVQRDTAGSDDTDFDPEKLEHESSTTSM